MTGCTDRFDNAIRTDFLGLLAYLFGVREQFIFYPRGPGKTAVAAEDLYQAMFTGRVARLGPP
eukprot:85431-Lingulodinium_polyedra.AAC.1